MVQSVKEQWDRIDILVTCAGIFPHRPIIEQDEAEWNRVIAVQLNGTFFCCQAVLPVMMAQRSGRIVITASGLAVYPLKGAAAYSAAKGGTISFARVLAKEAEPFGITVNAYGPGTTDTPMVRNISTPEEMAEHHRTAPFGRLPTAEQSAEMAVWFTRPETAHLTGRVFLQ
jgi:NAD(P)-dependent dehydrogenase (short-subunit alcohol dehydrogenase family)